MVQLTFAVPEIPRSLACRSSFASASRIMPSFRLAVELEDLRIALPQHGFSSTDE
jgi:hypothetical protein